MYHRAFSACVSKMWKGCNGSYTFIYHEAKQRAFSFQTHFFFAFITLVFSFLFHIILPFLRKDKTQWYVREWFFFLAYGWEVKTPFILKSTSFLLKEIIATWVTASLWWLNFFSKISKSTRLFFLSPQPDSFFPLFRLFEIPELKMERERENRARYVSFMN